MTQRRHLDDGRRLHAWADEIAVTCPACKAPGLVLASWKPYAWDAHFHCSQCAFSLDLADGMWYGPIRLTGQAPCGFCGHKWIAPWRDFAHPPARPPAHLSGTCPRCAHKTRVAVTASRRLADEPADPHFGLPLRLVTATRHGALWAYNGRHVAALQAFIAATLRERVGSTNRSMCSSLPAWVKLARHRDEVLRALDRLQRKLTAPVR